MKCKKSGEKCNSERCPQLQYLNRARRFDNWENLFETCKFLDTAKDAEDNVVGEDDFLNFDISDDDLQRDMEAN